MSGCIKYRSGTPPGSDMGAEKRLAIHRPMCLLASSPSHLAIRIDVLATSSLFIVAYLPNFLVLHCTANLKLALLGRTALQISGVRLGPGMAMCLSRPSCRNRCFAWSETPNTHGLRCTAEELRHGRTNSVRIERAFLRPDCLLESHRHTMSRRWNSNFAVVLFPRPNSTWTPPQPWVDSKEWRGE